MQNDTGPSQSGTVTVTVETRRYQVQITCSHIVSGTQPGNVGLWYCPFAFCLVDAIYMPIPAIASVRVGRMLGKGILDRLNHGLPSSLYVEMEK